MNSIEKLDKLFEEKRQQGLVDIKFSFYDITEDTTVEKLADEVISCYEAIAAGKTGPLQFDDRRHYNKTA